MPSSGSTKPAAFCRTDHCGVYTLSMEKFPQKRASRLRNTINAALAGAAFIGAADGGNVPQAEAQSSRSAIEREAQFDAEKEAEAFIREIAKMELPFDDARGRQGLRSSVQARLDVFTLALQEKKPHFSANQSSSISGTINPYTRKLAIDTLIPKLTKSTENPAIQVLQSLIKPVGNLSAGKTGNGEVRRVKNKDW
jgi:hypothetical protein